jgi:hypothetical protein
MTSSEARLCRVVPLSLVGCPELDVVVGIRR